MSAIVANHTVESVKKALTDFGLNKIGIHSIITVNNGRMIFGRNEKSVLGIDEICISTDYIFIGGNFGVFDDNYLSYVASDLNCLSANLGGAIY